MQLNLKAKPATSYRRVPKIGFRFYGLVFLLLVGSSLIRNPEDLNLSQTKSVSSFDPIGLGVIVLPTVLKNTTVLNGNNSNGYVGISGGFVQGLPQFVQTITGPVQIYVRSWTTGSTNSEIAIEAIETQSVSGAISAFNAAKNSFDKIKGTMRVVKVGILPGIHNSVEIELSGKVSGITVLSLQTFFVAKNIIFAVRMDSAENSFTESQLEQISISQKNRADQYILLQNTSSSQTPYLIVLALAVSMVLGLIILLHLGGQRRRKLGNTQLIEQELDSPGYPEAVETS